MIDLDNYGAESDKEPDAAEVLKAKRYAARFLSSRMYTANEIVERLRRKGYTEAAAEEAVLQLTIEGAIDDLLYAEFYITDAVNIGYKGMYRIRQELMRKGVAASVIDRAAAKAEVDCIAALSEFVEQRLERTVIETRRDYEKFRTMLARRGYSLGEIREVLSGYEFDFKE
mgnify:CR=1 FL=1